MQTTAPDKAESRMIVRKMALWLFFLFLSGTGFSQIITLSLKRVPIEQAFREIEKKTPYRFVYTKEMVAQSSPVSIEATNVPVQKVIALIFENQPLAYSVDETFITVQFKPGPVLPVQSGIDVQGKVYSESGEPLSGATVMIKGEMKSAATNSDGSFLLQDVKGHAILVISNVGYKSKEVAVNGRSTMEINLEVTVRPLDETVVIAYGTTTKKLNTGNVGKVTAEEISRQPVANPLAALQGRVPGLIVTQSSGLNGAGFKVQIRGQNSILQGSDPLYIIDGVPFAPGNRPINQVTNATNVSGLSPFNLINPADIESIEVLKDADATAIYGSRGANGVILITTKKGKAGTTRFTANVYSGSSRVTRAMDMLNTKQYLQMRREAFENDGIIPDQANAPDLMLWDTTRYTDLKKLLIGGTALTTDAQVSLSGGTTSTQFLVGGGYHKETSVFPTELGDRKASVHLNLAHASTDKKLTLGLTANYMVDKNEMHFNDPTNFTSLPPNVRLYDSTGKLNWEEGGVAFNTTIGDNPLANLRTQYAGNFTNLISNLQIGYKPFSKMHLRVSLGYNVLNSDEKQLNPSTSLDPNAGQLPYSFFATGSVKSWIIEPQAEYTEKWGRSRLTILMGATAQENERNGLQAWATDYTSDVFLNSVAGAGNVFTSNNYSQYRYNAIFGRIGYNWNDRYLLNLSGRRDGSSRFGPNKRFDNFGAIGAAWIFSSHPTFQRILPVISFGKLRASYGVTGNDQIGDYRFIDTWTVSPATYQGNSILIPTSLYNPDYEWERNKKLEIGLELGLLQDRILFSSAFFKNQSGNQIVQYSLPAQTGFALVGRNLNATVQNAGLELQLTSKNIQSKQFAWSSYFNISFIRNKLLSFPGLASSSYASVYTIGQSLSSRKVFQHLGMDSLGVYQFLDVNKDGRMNLQDRSVLVNMEPDFYGGWQNNFSWKGFELNFLFEFRRQKGANYLNEINNYPPGSMHNQPEIVLKRWQKAGDLTDVQKFTSIFGTSAYRAASLVRGSDLVYSDASFIRCKNLALAYHLPTSWLKPLYFHAGRIYMQAQNLFTITRYLGADPENQSLLVLPPLRTITAGIQLNLN